MADSYGWVAEGMVRTRNPKQVWGEGHPRASETQLRLSCFFFLKGEFVTQTADQNNKQRSPYVSNDLTCLAHGTFCLSPSCHLLDDYSLLLRMIRVMHHFQAKLVFFSVVQSNFHVTIGPFSVATYHTRYAGKNVPYPRGMLLVTRLLASQQA
jgi:hypothetical protein